MKTFWEIREELSEAKLPKDHGSIEVNDHAHPNEHDEGADDGTSIRHNVKKNYGLKMHAMHSTSAGYYRVRFTGHKDKIRDFAHNHLDYDKKDHPSFEHLKHAIGKDQGDHD